MTMYFSRYFLECTQASLKFGPVHVYMSLLSTLCYYRSGRFKALGRAIGLCVAISSNLGMQSLHMRENN